jgi:hypothetical protein
MSTVERVVEDAIIALIEGMAGDIPVGRWAALSEDKATVKIYVAAQPFEDFNYATDTPHGKIVLQVVVSSYVKDDPDREELDNARDVFETAWATATTENVTNGAYFVVDGFVIGKRASGFNEHGFQNAVYEYELFGHYA